MKRATGITLAVGASLGALLLITAVALWPLLRSEHLGREYVIEVQPGGDAGHIRFEVYDVAGNAAPGVRVSSLSESGWTHPVVTDQLGKVSVAPGENDVQAVRIGDDEMRLAPDLFPLSVVFSPGVERGLKVLARPVV